MKILITGATGFLGRYLVDECVRRGDRVRVLVRAGSDTSHLHFRKGLEYAIGDVTAPGTLPEAVDGVDAVIHAAGLVRDFGAERDFTAANVRGTGSLLSAARAAGVRRFLYVSSPSAVMTGGDQRDIDESVPYPQRFLNAYARSKATAERSVLAADRPWFVTSAIRPRGIWGPGDRAGFLPRILVRLSRSTMPDLSGREPVHASLCYCVNAALACRLAVEADPGRAGGRSFFVADAERTDVWALINRVARMFDLPPPGRRVPRIVRRPAAVLTDTLWRLPFLADHEPPISRYTLALLTRTGTYDTGAARRDLGYAPPVSQDAGLSAVYRWITGIGGVGALAG